MSVMTRRGILGCEPGNDRGATAVVVAILIAVLLGVGAVAVDLAQAFNERRQDQTSSDLSSMSGALSYGFEQTNESAVTNVLETARSNLRDQYSGPNDPAWVAAWRNCTDPDQLGVTLDEPAAWNAIGTPNPGNELECISYNTNFFRVALPDQLTDATFGRLLGLNVLTTAADTIVTYQEGASGLLPFAVVADAPFGEICLDTGASPEPPCDKNDRGSFGMILPPQWGLTGLPQYCPNNGNGVGGLAAATARGVDHLLRPYLASQWALSPFFGNPDWSGNADTVKGSSVNVDICTTTAGASAVPADLSHDPNVLPINGVVIDTGNSAKSAVSDGLISGMTFGGSPSRLQQPGGKDWITAHHGNSVQWQLDNTPLWYWLDPTVAYGTDAPASCDPTIFTIAMETGAERNDRMITCLLDWVGGGYVPIFTDEDLLDEPRFGVAPQLWTNDLGNGFQARPIKAFVPVYIAGVKLSSKNGAPFWYTNGTDDSGFICLDNNGNRKAAASGCRSLLVDQVTAYLLPPGSWGADIAAGLYPGTTEDDLTPTIWK